MLRTLIFAAALATAPAMAADMPVKSPYVAPVVATGWQGMYLGFQGGANLGSFNPFCGTACGPEATTVNLKDNSAFVGGHLGYLAQVSSFVIGPELGVQWLGFKSQADLAPAVVVGGVTVTPAVLLQQKIDFLAYANLRVGLSPLTNTLIYVTGGAAWAHSKSAVLNLAALDTVNADSIIGWNVGGGLEFKLSPNLILGAEYRHYDFGDVKPANATLFPVTAARLTMEQAMARLSYRLN